MLKLLYSKVGKLLYSKVGAYTCACVGGGVWFVPDPVATMCALQIPNESLTHTQSHVIRCLYIHNALEH